MPGGGPGGYAAVLSDEYWSKHFGAVSKRIGSTPSHRRRSLYHRRRDGRAASARLTCWPTRASSSPVQSEPVIDAPFNMLNAGVRTYWLMAGARLNPGVSLVQANAQLSAENAAIFHRTTASAGWAAHQLQAHARILATSGAQGYSFMRRSLRATAQHSLRTLRGAAFSCVSQPCRPAPCAFYLAGARAGDAALHRRDARAIDAASCSWKPAFSVLLARLSASPSRRWSRTGSAPCCLIPRNRSISAFSRACSCLRCWSPQRQRCSPGCFRHGE